MSCPVAVLIRRRISPARWQPRLFHTAIGGARPADRTRPRNLALIRALPDQFAPRAIQHETQTPARIDLARPGFTVNHSGRLKRKFQPVD